MFTDKGDVTTGIAFDTESETTKRANIAHICLMSRCDSSETNRRRLPRDFCFYVFVAFCRGASVRARGCRPRCGSPPWCWFSNIRAWWQPYCLGHASPPDALLFVFLFMPFTYSCLPAVAFGAYIAARRDVVNARGPFVSARTLLNTYFWLVPPFGLSLQVVGARQLHTDGCQLGAAHQGRSLHLHGRPGSESTLQNAPPPDHVIRSFFTTT